MPLSPPDEDPYLEDVNDLHGWLTVMKRTVPPEKWVEELVVAAELDSFKGVM